MTPRSDAAEVERLRRRVNELESRLAERDREREEVERLRTFYRRILDEFPTQIAVLGPDLRYQYVNPASISDPELRRWIVGKTDAEYCRHRGRSLSVARDRDRRWRRAIEERRAITCEEEMVTPSGERRVFIRTHSPVFEADGTLSRLIGYGVDVTEHRRLEEELRQSQKLEAIGKLAGGVAHDFNNVLTAILGYSQLLLLQLDAGPIEPSLLRRQLEEIRKAADHAATLTRQLLAFGRKQVLQTEDFDLDAVIRDLVQLLRTTLGDAVELRFELASGGRRVHADRSQLRQVLINLAVNARDALPGGGTVTVATAAVDLAAGALGDGEPRKPGSYLRLTVGDDGVGMDEATRERAFEPFFTTKEPGEGTGLGLATVYGIVKQSGGQITVDSAPGRGTRLDLYLPTAAGSPSTRR